MAKELLEIALTRQSLNQEEGAWLSNVWFPLYSCLMKENSELAV